MDEICRDLTLKLKEAGADRYTIFYEDELLEILPEDLRSREALEAALKKLSAENYIEVKYARGEAFCLRLLKLYDKAVELSNESAEQFSFPKKIYVVTAICAFLGAALGGAVCAAVFCAF